MKYFRDNDTFIFVAEKCTGCGVCIEVCPHAVFEVNSDGVRPVNSERCMECGACSRNCEFGALSVKVGVGCASAVITGLIRGSEPTCDCSGPESSCC
jgi:NAD-dependent dihydropyrimidine dehydrogenase PreA subunit